ncbi:hypothetical protein F5Y06DRAFT_303786 [Hypoxylon sp. FL0890]|nr:hypothetical protein F5Y06DRAFT_303786 [Hypoxylon sp. FL0890]
MGRMSLGTKYAPLEWGKSTEDPDDDIEHGQEDSQLMNEARPRQTNSQQVWATLRPWVLHGTVMLVYAIALPYLFFLFGMGRQNCVDKFYAYSPINPAISEEFEDVTFDGSLWYKSPYKGPPTPEVNQAWEDLMAYGAISVTADDITRVGHNLTAVQYPPEAGGGYLAVAMGTHHIHCLHYVWQDHHSAYFPTTAANKAEAPEMYERHYEHCIDYLRQAIMCNFDPGIIPYYWVRQHNQPTPDGNTRHKCVNWKYLQDWLKQRAVEIPEGFEWHQPPDAVSLDKNP